jgi:hypothetical protein
MGMGDALTLSLNAPEQAYVQVNYSVALQVGEAEPSQTYDVKLMMKEEGRENLSSILVGEEWKSTFYYLKGVYPSTMLFTLLPRQASEQAHLCARIRKTGAKSFIEYCQVLQIKQEEAVLSSPPRAPRVSVDTKADEKEEENRPLQKELVPLSATPSLTPPSSPETPIQLTPPRSYQATSSSLYLSLIFSVLVGIVLLLLLTRKI